MRRGSETKPRVHGTHFPFPGTDQTTSPCALASGGGAMCLRCLWLWAEGTTYPPPRLAVKHPIQSFALSLLSTRKGTKEFKMVEPYDGKEPDP